MRKGLFALSAMILISQATGALAGPLCSGDFRYVRGGWIADPSCEHSAAQSIVGRPKARKMGDPVDTHQESRDEFCRWHNDIQTDVYCAPYKD